MKQKHHPPTATTQAQQNHTAHYEKLLYKLVSPHKIYTHEQLYQLLDISKDRAAQRTVQATILALVKNGKVKQLSKMRYTWVPAAQYVIGHVDYVNPAYAYIVPKDAQEQKEDIWVKQENLLGALDKDLVKVVVQPQQRNNGQRIVGKVIEVITRNKAPIVGRIVQRGTQIWVVADRRRMHHDILIKDNHHKHAQQNDKVIVEIVDWPTQGGSPVGIIQKVLGQVGVHDVEMHAIMAEFGLADTFSAQVQHDANAISHAIAPHEIAKRKDFRAVPTLTIDPEDAKDFDDALSLKKLPNGHYEVGIHIADVSHYVQEGSPIDQEALARGTSVYLVDRTIPMLPERLSNDLCSLNPDEDKLTFSTVLELDALGNVQQMWIGETVIRSQKRFTYETAQQVLDQQKGDFYEVLTQLHQLARQLRTKRFQKGAINFETTEVKFQLDEQGNPLKIVPKVWKDVHKLVEEFMLLANETVATHVAKMKPIKGLPTFVYRTHDNPDPDKLYDFWQFAAQLGYRTAQQQSVAKALNDILDATKGSPAASIIHSLAIRTMAKATYTSEEKRHFGLALQHYTHFTSPIRRYPDIMVHRLLKQYLKGHFEVDPKSYVEKCQHTSERERIAIDAERASIRYKQVEWMRAHEGNVFEGIINGVTSWGIYVELIENRCEGMIRLANMTNDYYELDEKGFKVVGKRTKKVYRLGDRIDVQVEACDLAKRTVNLRLITTTAASSTMTART